MILEKITTHFFVTFIEKKVINRRFHSVKFSRIVDFTAYITCMYLTSFFLYTEFFAKTLKNNRCQLKAYFSKLVTILLFRTWFSGD